MNARGGTTRTVGEWQVRHDAKGRGWTVQRNITRFGVGWFRVAWFSEVNDLRAWAEAVGADDAWSAAAAVLVVERKPR